MKNTLIILSLSSVSAWAVEKTPPPTTHTTRTIEGWSVRVDDRLLKGEHAAVGTRALKLLESRLVAVAFVAGELKQAPRLPSPQGWVLVLESKEHQPKPAQTPRRP